LEFETDRGEVEKKNGGFVLELLTLSTTSRELSRIPTVPTSDRNKSSFDPWKPFGEAATNAAVQRPKFKEKRCDPDLWSPRRRRTAARRRRPCLNAASPHQSDFVG